MENENIFKNCVKIVNWWKFKNESNFHENGEKVKKIFKNVRFCKNWWKFFYIIDYLVYFENRTKILRKLLTKRNSCAKIEIVKVFFINIENNFHKMQKLNENISKSENNFHSTKNEMRNFRKEANIEQDFTSSSAYV